MCLIDGSSGFSSTDVGVQATPAAVADDLRGQRGVLVVSSDMLAGQKNNSDKLNGCISKDKTPMCLVNELSRFNKVSI